MLKLFVVVLCSAAAVHAVEDVQYAQEDDFELRKYLECTYRKYIYIRNFASVFSSKNATDIPFNDAMMLTETSFLYSHSNYIIIELIIELIVM